MYNYMSDFFLKLQFRFSDVDALPTGNKLQPTRLFCPWNSPGKNTGVGFHSLFQGNIPDLGNQSRSSTLQADSLPQSYEGAPVPGIHP